MASGRSRRRAYGDVRHLIIVVSGFRSKVDVADGDDQQPARRFLQDDRFEDTGSITICGFTTQPLDAPLFRLLTEPSETNGLTTPCRLMVDKITTVPKTKLGRRIGRRLFGLNDRFRGGRCSRGRAS